MDKPKKVTVGGGKKKVGKFIVDSSYILGRGQSAFVYRGENS